MIIGAGIIGAAIAYRLAKAGAAVTVVEAIAPAAGASGKSFGWINASFHATRAHFDLRQAAITAHRELADDLGPTGTLWQGTLWWEQGGDAFDAQAASLTALGYPLREVGRAEFASLEPWIANPPDRSLLFQSEGATDPVRLCDRLLAGAARHGAKLCLGTVATGLWVISGRVSGILTAQGALAADHVIVAAGTASEGLLAEVGVRLPMVPRPGVLFQTPALPPMLRHILVSPGHELRQDAAGHILSPVEAAHQTDDSPVLADQAATLADLAVARLRALLPGVDLQWQRVLTGYRPVPADGLPVIGQALPGLTVATMHSGVTLAPLIGSLVAAEVLRGDLSPLLSTFRPSRFNQTLVNAP